MASQSRAQTGTVSKMYKPLLGDPKTQARFWAKVKKTTDCWDWVAGKNSDGYGIFWFQGRPWQAAGAHRVAYELLRGEIPGGLTIDHLCRNHGCVNPDHMDSVTSGENVLRGQGPGALNAKKTCCLLGHPFNETNTIRRKSGKRECHACKIEAARKYRLRAGIAVRQRHGAASWRTQLAVASGLLTMDSDRCILGVRPALSHRRPARCERRVERR